MAVSKAWREFLSKLSTVPVGLRGVLCSSNSWHYVLRCQCLAKAFILGKGNIWKKPVLFFLSKQSRPRREFGWCWVGSDAQRDGPEWRSWLLQLVENRYLTPTCAKWFHYYISDHCQTSIAQYFSFSKSVIGTAVKI